MTLVPVDPPYIITADYVIPEGVTVTVMEGTEIMVAGLNWIDVQGKIVATGSAEHPIIFTSANSAPDLGQWRGIKLHNPNEVSEFDHCIFTYGAYFETDTLSDRGRDAQNYKGMLAINNSSPRITRSVVTQIQNNAVFLTGSNSRPVIRYNVFTRNDASGVRGDATIDPTTLDISYNCISENSAPGFILSNDNPDDSLGIHRIFGDPTTINVNLDSCDSHFNIDLLPLFNDPREGELTNLADYSLQSCSPCVDAGPVGADLDPDATRADMGAIPYAQAAGELRGRLETNLGNAVYRMSCDVVIPPGVTVTISEGARIEATGLFNIEVYGRLLVNGVHGNEVDLCACQTTNGDFVGGMIFFDRGDEPSVVRHLIVRDFNRVVVNKAGVRFEDCQFQSGFLGGALVATGVTAIDSAVVFDNCEFTNVGASAVEVLSSSAKIHNTWINGSRGQGISLNNVGTGVEIYNTIVEACSVTAVSMEDFCSPRIVNNTFTGTGYYGVHMKNNCQPTLLNNIIVNSGRYGILAQFSSAPFIDYNDVWNNGLRDNTLRITRPTR
ncbi:MAG: right-handed parallel beta-helix repeat-containing protein [bacterium]|nr:right-handed parallel beta-helix repeat-containing protein [bacterium]